MGQLEDMTAFVRIVDAGTISRAAEQSGMAKSALSRRLSDLETRMNVQLLNRTTRKSSLTEAGRSYYARAQQIINDVNELHALTSNAKAALQGDLKIAVPNSFGLLHLTPLINEFAKLHPQIDFQVNFSDGQVDLVEEGFDIAVRIAELKNSSHIARKLTQINLILCTSPEYILKTGSPQDPHDLKNHDFIGYSLSSNSSFKLTDAQGSETILRPSFKINANNGEYLCAAAIAGLGIAALPTFLVSKAIDEGKLIQLLPQYSLPAFNAYALYPQTRHLSRRVRVFIDFLVDKFAGPPHWDAPVFKNSK
ncbi:Transcriptional regulator, LysR family [hydrothermal vent metagenome]|uniref:Transcriptional regulator, LysR family n=1 Tax=hydrothermal vent metagenome TaxID=652676 RepID=A0A3B1AMS5_9ZZZZ